MSEKEITRNFVKLISDFLNDIKTTFPEYNTVIEETPELNVVFNNSSIDISDNESLLKLKEHCVSVYPERFFDILYKNENIFLEENDKNCFFLPNINFKELWTNDITENTKNVIWQYLQLILFSVSKMVDGAESFGETAKLFEAINENELFNKLEETIENMEDVFDMSNINLSEDTNDISGLDMPNPNELHSHLKDLLDGSLGKLAHEIAEETAKDLETDMGDAKSVGDVFQKLFKDPSKLMNMVKKVGSKLDEKIKSGEIKESELMKEASELMTKMTNMPGMKNMEKVFSKMGIPMGKNSKINMNAFQSNMRQNIRQSKQKERMLAKLEQRRKEKELKQLNDKKNYNFSTFTTNDGEVMEKSSVKKKKKRKKKNRNKIKK